MSCSTRGFVYRVSFSEPALVNHWPKYQSGSWGMCAQPEKKRS